MEHKTGAKPFALVPSSSAAEASLGSAEEAAGGSPVTMNSLRKLVKAGEEGSRSRVCKLFHTNVPAECLDAMEQSAAKKMGLEFDGGARR
ncbi:hypothetical protein GUJ93_ZPchr0075g2718 [Zizania palustris]|uniref:Uncharacterized protein n=1 Tax=Zizania palustris TaxID=103762 RepID=A0A8J5VHH7_ZIZPA|nr:hypothetical protein GUJ93_ZPchr0075g2718 [Zizania palustris]